MAAVSFSITASVQDAFQVGETAPQAASNVTPINANQAQGAPAPADTVTLTNQTAEGQQPGADPNRGHFGRAAFLDTAGAYIGTNAARPNHHAPEPALPLLPPQTPAQTQDATAATTTTPANVAANSGVNTVANTANTPADTAGPPSAGAPGTGSSANANAPQQELQTLDRTLQQLGINPQSITLFNSMAMLLYASDPAALRLLVQTMQGAVAQQGGTQTTSSVGNANQAAVQALLLTARASESGSASGAGRYDCRCADPATKPPRATPALRKHNPAKAPNRLTLSPHRSISPKRERATSPRRPLRASQPRQPLRVPTRARKLHSRAR